MYLKLDGANVVAGLLDGVATFVFSGSISRATVATASTMFRLLHSGPPPIAIKMRFDGAVMIEGASWCTDPIDRSPHIAHLPVVVVVHPEALEWALGYAHARAMEGRVLGVFTSPDLARRWVLARAAAQPVANSVAAHQKITSAR